MSNYTKDSLEKAKEVCDDVMKMMDDDGINFWAVLESKDSKELVFKYNSLNFESFILFIETFLRENIILRIEVIKRLVSQISNEERQKAIAYSESINKSNLH